MNTENRSFRYGDGFFETILALKKADGSIEIPLWVYHQRRIQSSLACLQMQMPSCFSFARLRRALNKAASSINSPSQKIRLRITFFRSGGGLYTPLSQEAAWHAEAQAYTPKLGELKVCIAQGIAKMANMALSNCKSTSAALYVQAALQAQANKCDEALIINNLGEVCEGTASNIFLIFRPQNGKRLRIITPPLSSGCVAGVLRACLLDLLRRAGLCVEEQSVSLEDIQSCDALWLTNALAGVRWARAVF